jgi:hypothetical protein
MLGISVARESAQLKAGLAPNYNAAVAAATESNLPLSLAILDWANDAHQLARAVAYGDLSADNPAPITAAYEQRADRAIEIQLEKARVRLAWLLNKVLGHAIKPSAK